MIVSMSIFLPLSTSLSESMSQICLCFPTGTCIDLLNNYSCICKVGYTGEHCEIPITRCNRDSCYPGVQCTEISHSISCGPCPTGFAGDGKNCRGS